MKPSNEIIDDILPAVARNVKATECIEPVFFIGQAGNRGEVGILVANMSNDEMKNETAQAVRTVARNTNADFVLMVAESWAIDSRGVSEAELANVEAEGLSNHPKRKDIVLLRYETPTESWCAMVDILPGREMGEVVWTKTKPDEEKGRFTGFFERQSVH